MEAHTESYALRVLTELKYNMIPNTLLGPLHLILNQGTG